MPRKRWLLTSLGAVALLACASTQPPDVQLAASPAPTASQTSSGPRGAAQVCAASVLQCSIHGCMFVRADWLAKPIEVQHAACTNEHQCLAYGARLALAEGVAYDDAQARSALSTACDAHDSLGCIDLAKLQNPTFEHFAAMCEQGTGEACLEAGNEIRFGAAGKTHTPGDGARYYQRACERGVGNACARLGFHYGTGLGVTRDDRRAYELFNHACDCHDDVGCSGLGYLLRDGQGVKKDTARAQAIFEDLCSRDVLGSCVHLGAMYADGTGVSVDLEHARALYTRACDGRVRVPEGAQGCTELGLLYRRGTGVPRDDSRAFEFFKEACDVQVHNGCAELGRMYRDGLGTARDIARARQLLTWACDHGATGACADRDALSP